MNRKELIHTAADRIWKSLSDGAPCPPVRDLLGTDDLELAYAVQQVNTQRRIDRGEKIVASKVGLTSEAVQKQIGVDQPDFGILTDAMHVLAGGVVSWRELHQPKIEAEIAFILSDDLPMQTLNMSELIEYIQGACVSLEIVGSRIENWSIRITDTIADNASASHFVLSDTIVGIDSLDLEACKMTLKRGGELVSEGIGAACMGNPLNAVLWLANTFAKMETPLRKGEAILAGALGPMVVVSPGEAYEAEIEGLGSVGVSFGKPD